MGTRADFYVGRGEKAEWLGSIAWDGYPDGKPKDLVHAKYPSAGAWRKAVKVLLATSEDATVPEQGWPWPWENSHLTDYSYAYDKGKVWATHYGYDWWDTTLPEPQEHGRLKTTVFPDMTNRQNVTLGKRSGVMVLGIPMPKPEDLE